MSGPGSSIACPMCGGRRAFVKDKRTHDKHIRRRRQCGDCGGRYTTHEVLSPRDGMRPTNRQATSAPVRAALLDAIDGLGKP